MGGCLTAQDADNVNRQVDKASANKNAPASVEENPKIVVNTVPDESAKVPLIEEKPAIVPDIVEEEEPATIPEIVEKKVEPAVSEEKEAPAAGSSSNIVTRKSIGSMTTEEHQRFWDALRTTMISKNGPGSSEYFRVSAYHGEPGKHYCHHGKETFPGWHRIYMLEMEHALQAADRENGNDGNVFLPYWDWANNYKNGVPDIVRKEFAWPDDLFPVDLQKNPMVSRGLRYANSRQVANGIRAGKLPGQAEDGLREVQHWRYASTASTGQYPSLEDPHNSMHVVVGGRLGQMASVAWAAYDIVFYLHHCNIDRLYEGYITLEPDSQQEFENFENNQRIDLFDQAFEPFRKPNGDKYYPADTFSTARLGYVYDKIPPAPPQQLRIPPILVVFDNVELYKFNGKCYQIHVYILDEKKESEFKEPETNSDINYDDENYAGFQSIFNRGEKCETCKTNPPRDIVLDISKTIMRLQISRYAAVAKVYLYETTGDSDILQKVEDNEILPNPRITGPLFESHEHTLDCDHSNEQSKHEVRGLQRYLVKFGYLAGGKESIHGKYDEITEQAVRDFKSAVGGLQDNGVTCSQTKLSIIGSKRCANIDPFAKNDVRDEKVMNINYGKNDLNYSVSVSPGYMKRIEVLECFALAFKCWSDVCGVTFNIVNDESKADIVLSWSTGNEKNDVLRFDGPGGVLGHGGNGYVQFDYGEKWVIGLGKGERVSILNDPETWNRGFPNISLYYTAVHEIGHALGLDHSQSTNDLMSPWYVPDFQMTENDIQRIQAIYGENQ